MKLVENVVVSELFMALIKYREEACLIGNTCKLFNSFTECICIMRERAVNKILLFKVFNPHF